jgi:hypothetical protein
VAPDTPEKSWKERRRLKRFVQKIPVRFQTGTLRGQGSVGNLHQEGMFIQSHVLPERYSEVTISLGTPEGGKIEVFGSVRWTTTDSPLRGKGTGFGVQLHHVGEDYLRFFERLLLA